MKLKTKMPLPLVLMSAALVTPAYSNTFHGLYPSDNLNVGSSSSPTPQSIRNNRHYPLASKLANEEGTVGLKISLTEQGMVSDAVVEKSSGFPRLDKAAVEYVKANWTYNKSDRDGQPIPATARVNLTFDMP